MLLQAILSLVFFIRFAKNSKKSVVVIDAKKHQDVYFEQLLRHLA